MESEITRFDATKGLTLVKYNLIDRPEGKLKDKVNIAVDGLSTLCLGTQGGGGGAG